MNSLKTQTSRLTFTGHCVSTTWHGFSPAYIHSILRISLYHKYENKAKMAVMESFLSLSRCENSSASRCEFARFLNVLNAAVLDLVPISSDRAEKLSLLLNSLLRQRQQCLFEASILRDLFQIIDLVMYAPSAPLMAPLCLLFWLPEEMHAQEMDWETMDRQALKRRPPLELVFKAKQQIAHDAVPALVWDERWPKQYGHFLWRDNFYTLEYAADVPRDILYPWLLHIMANFSTHRTTNYRVLFWVRQLLAAPAAHPAAARQGRVGLLWWCCKVGLAFCSPGRLSTKLLAALRENWQLTNSLFPLYQALVGCLWEVTDMKQDTKSPPVESQLMDFVALDSLAVDLQLEDPEEPRFHDLPQSELMYLKPAVFAPEKKLSIPKTKQKQKKSDMGLYTKGPLTRQQMDQEMRFYRVWNLLSITKVRSFPFEIREEANSLTLSIELAFLHIWGNELPLWVWAMPSVAIQVLMLLVARLLCGQEIGLFSEILFEYGHPAPQEVLVFPTRYGNNSHGKVEDKTSAAFVQFVRGLKQIRDIDPLFTTRVWSIARQVSGVPGPVQCRVSDFLRLVSSSWK